MIDGELPEIKMILLGETGVGKTAIIKRFYYDKFDMHYTPTDSMNFIQKDLNINNQKVKLNIWDTIGQEKYRSLSKMFLNETKIVILVYSINDPHSFEELNYWKNLYKEQLGEDVILGVAANKIDLIYEQKVSEESGKEFAKQNKAIFSSLSAKENRVGIEEFINNLVKEYLYSKKKKINIEDFEIIEERKKGIVLSKKKMDDYGYNQGGCCGGKSKARKTNYEDIVKNKRGIIETIFLGLNGVGKTSLIKRVDGKDFNPKEKHTKKITEYETEYTNDNMQFIVKIYDIDNEQKINKETLNTVKKCQIYFLVYDINNDESLKEIIFWLNVINNYKRYEKAKNNYVIAIIGNKKDLQKNENELIDDNNNISGIEGGKKLSILNKTIFYTTTAKDDKDIKDVIGIAIEKLINSN